MRGRPRWVRASWQRAGSGVCARRRSNFFCQKKSPKKASLAVCDPFAALRGNLRRGTCGVRRGTHFAAVQLRSDSHGEPVNEACAHQRACHPASTPPQAHPQGLGTTRAFAALGLGKKRRAAMGRTCFSPGRAQQWPVRMSEPLWPCREAQGRADQGSRLFEHRRCELSETPSGTSIAGCPKRSAGTRTVGRAFFGDFLSLERKLLRRRAHTPAPALRQTHALHSLSGAAIKFHKITL